MKPHTSLPAAAPPQPTAVVAVLLSTDWPDHAPRGPLRVLATSNLAWQAHQLSLPGGKVEDSDTAEAAKHPACEDTPHWSVLRELREEAGVLTYCATAIPVWEGWQAGPVAHYVRAYRMVPQRGLPTSMHPEQGNRLVWIEPDRLTLVCPYEANAHAIEAALTHAALEGAAADMDTPQQGRP